MINPENRRPSCSYTSPLLRVFSVKKYWAKKGASTIMQVTLKNLLLIVEGWSLEDNHYLTLLLSIAVIFSVVYFTNTRSINYLLPAQFRPPNVQACHIRERKKNASKYWKNTSILINEFFYIHFNQFYLKFNSILLFS